MNTNLESRICSLRENATITDRIFTVQAQVANVVAFLEGELKEQIVYVHRSRVLLGVIHSTLTAMADLESQGVHSDFDDDWFELRRRLIQAQEQFQAIIAGSDAPRQPCQLHA